VKWWRFNKTELAAYDAEQRAAMLKNGDMVIDSGGWYNNEQQAEDDELEMEEKKEKKRKQNAAAKLAEKEQMQSVEAARRREMKENYEARIKKNLRRNPNIRQTGTGIYAGTEKVDPGADSVGREQPKAAPSGQPETSPSEQKQSYDTFFAMSDMMGPSDLSPPPTEFEGMPRSFEPGTDWDAKPMSDDSSTGTNGPEPERPRSLFDALDSSRTGPEAEPGKPGSLFDAQPAYDDRRMEPDVRPRTLFDAQPMYEEKPMEPDMKPDGFPTGADERSNEQVQEDEQFEEQEAVKAEIFARRSKALVELLAAGEDLPRKIAVYRTVIDEELLLMLDDRIETAKEFQGEDKDMVAGMEMLATRLRTEMEREEGTPSERLLDDVLQLLDVPTTSSQRKISDVYGRLKASFFPLQSDQDNHVDIFAVAAALGANEDILTTGAPGALDIEYVKKSDFLSEVAALLEGIKIENTKIEDALTRGGLAEEEEARLTGQLKERQIAADQVYNVLVIAERVEAVVPQPPPLTPIDYSNGALMGMLMNKGNPDE